MSQIPFGPQAMLVEAVKELGASIKEQAQVSQNQISAALAPLQASLSQPQRRGQSQIRCFRCGNTGHMRRECPAGSVWCQRCQANTHDTAACRRGSGNGKASARGPCTGTQTAASNPSAFPAQVQQLSGPPAEEVSAWTWQPQ